MSDADIAGRTDAYFNRTKAIVARHGDCRVTTRCSVQIVASSGFGGDKCRVMVNAGAPIDVVRTGSFLPEQGSETYATADIVAYDVVARVEVGREFLLQAVRGQETDLVGRTRLQGVNKPPYTRSSYATQIRVC